MSKITPLFRKKSSAPSDFTEIVGCVRAIADGAIYFDCMSGRVCKTIDWLFSKGLFWEDQDTLKFRTALIEHYDVHASTHEVWEAVVYIAHENRVHPIRDYLSSLKWDGSPRLESWLHHAFGAPLTDYIKAIGRNFLIGACARIIKPGCKVDSLIILEGPQGIGKTSALEILFGEDWTTDVVENLSDKDFFLKISGFWLCVLGELSSLRKSDRDRIKQLITMRYDDVRRPWGRVPERRYRQCVFAGTTNLNRYLDDMTGNRRFWPIECTKVDLQFLESNRDRLWAEAACGLKSGANWWDIPDIETAEAQENKMIEDPWEKKIANWLEYFPTDSLIVSDDEGILKVEGRRVMQVDTYLLCSMALNLKDIDMTRSVSTRIGLIMAKNQDYLRRKITIGDKRSWVYSFIG